MKRFFFLMVFLSTIASNAQWQPDVRLTVDPAVSHTSASNARCIAANGNIVHVVWFDGRDGSGEIYYKRSTDNGISWEADMRLTNNTFTSYMPSVSVSGLFVHVVWEDDRDGNYEIYYKRSTDGGVSWGVDTRLTNNSHYSVYSTVAVSGSAVHVVWRDERDGNDEIYHKRSTDAGISWGVDTRLTNNPAFSVYATVAASGQNVHVVWHDDRGINWRIYYKRSTDGGVSWGTDTYLTNSSGSESPSISVSDSTVHIAWWDVRDGNEEIYYKRSINRGVSWGTDIRLTNDILYSMFPSISNSGQIVHVIWRDERDGNKEIYYKRSIDGGLVWENDIG
jgi:hypothetical protein